ncbi:23S rRNA (guanosine(2251)-2'-O)-methyltransferase RlmB [Runella sp. MFBS21]|uniref:23S rRNA (guanosine(2251)-2'-O)-methyltransferase RlmB n=1 Tax=Runella sp. MFBS21 TaxID=3034018 RepID=UPI0023F9E436|nr:23S rRNA (guanosine(2251)-2'-O)-methyltransferase RlmB [Runella sp. MFBS21]MDF7819004.1 23S rRNA (guanosine(2251)-2'-O)-methyltransferase RlmB [Runella sp. MFBS21]
MAFQKDGYPPKRTFHTTKPVDKAREKELVFGIQSVAEAIRAGQEIDKIMIYREQNFNEIQQLAAEREIPVQRVPMEKLNQITRKNHQGVIAFMSAIRYVSLHNILATIFEKGEVPLLLLLDRITDVRNFGAIARTAECMGVHAIVVPMRGAAQINSDALKTSSGALNYLPVCRENNLIDAVQYLQDSGVQIVVCTEKASQIVSNIDFASPTAIVMGSEEDGVSPDLIRRANMTIKIPMIGKVSSLNVSVAAGMVIYEAARQRS